MIWYIFFQFFIEFGFMCWVFVVCLVLLLSIIMLGVFLLLWCMSLMGDVLLYVIFFGVVVGYLLSGMLLLVMIFGGFIVGIVVVLVVGWVSWWILLKEDVSFVGFYLGLLVLGVILVLLCGFSVDFLYLLFGFILVVDCDVVLFVSGVVSLMLLCIVLCYCGLVCEVFDSVWLQVNYWWLFVLLYGFFLVLLVFNLVVGFQVFGMLMVVGVMMFLVVVVCCWVCMLLGILLLVVGMGVFCVWLGLSFFWVISFFVGFVIVLIVSVLFFVLLFFGMCSWLLVGWCILMG